MGIVKEKTRWRRESAASTVTIIDDTLQMKDDDTVDAFTAKLNGYATKAKELGKTLDESLLVRKLLDSTPDRFIQIVASIEQTSDLDEITLDEITGKLKAFEERIKLRKGGQMEIQENLLFAQGEHSRKGRRFSKRGGRSNFSRGNWQNNRNRNNSQGGNSNHKGNSTRNKGEWDLSKIRCHKCKKFGHLRRDCRGTSTTQEQSNLILEEDDEPSLLMTTHEEVLLNEGQIQPVKYASGDASIWYLDNGASNHMTGVKSHFMDIDESVTGGMKRIFKKRSKKKAKNKQIQAREGKDQVKSKSKVIRMKKIQLEGLKLPSLKLYYKRLKRQGSKLPTE
ncbi:zinc finger, CCHC-type containing protein [Tanacetum coccineum]